MLPRFLSAARWTTVGIMIMIIIMIIIVIIIINIIIIVVNIFFLNFARQYKACRLENC